MTARKYKIAAVETVFYAMVTLIDWRVAVCTFLIHWGWNIYKNSRKS